MQNNNRQTAWLSPDPIHKLTAIEDLCHDPDLPYIDVWRGESVSIRVILQIKRKEVSRYMHYVKIDFTRDKRDRELIEEIRDRIRTINEYIQHPDGDTLFPLLGGDLAERYGLGRVERITDAVLWGANDIIEDASEKFTLLYETFNERYFDGKLPHYDVTVRLAISNPRRTIWRERRIIELLAGSEARMVTELLGAMAHIATTDGFGQRWRAEINRLFRAGAPMEVCPDTADLSADEFVLTVTGTSTAALEQDPLIHPPWRSDESPAVNLNPTEGRR